MLYFNPRSPHGERRSFHSLLHDFDIHFNPRSPHGERQCSTSLISWAVIFQSTLPARGATNCFCNRPCINAFQSTLPARGATHRRATRRCCSRYFNPRSPHGERRGQQRHEPPDADFNPRSPHGERRDLLHCRREPTGHFNPRSPHGERRKAENGHEKRRKFQSTLPARGATFKGALAGIGSGISIHAPRTGSDVRFTFYYMILINISIHAPRTGSDALKLRLVRAAGISIHAPRTGSDKSRRVR